MSGGIEAVAIKNLQTILKSRGISAEALFSKYDLDDNGTLNLSEFEAALTSITGQKAPGAIVNAIFSVLDSDGNGVIDLREILALVDSGPSETYIEGNSLTISDHPNEFYNGTYAPNGETNGKPIFMNSNGARMYFYNAGSGGASSWSLDDREQNGDKDYYRGGWTRPPANGELPLGTRRWVGVGRITIEMNSSEQVDESTEQGTLSDTEDLTDTSEYDRGYETPEIEVVESDDPSVLMSDVSEDFTNILGNLEASEFSTLESLQTAREIADNEAESKISKLPTLFQNPARELWKAKADSFQLIATSRIPSSADVALGLSAATLGVAAASSLADNPAQIPVAEEKEPQVQLEEEVIQDTPDNASFKELSGVESVSGHDTIHTIIQSFSSAGMLSEQNSLNEKFSGTLVTVQVRVSSIERSFGIGIDDKYRGGSTIIASLTTPQGGSPSADVEIRMPSDRDISSYKPGHEEDISCMFDGWNSIRKRVILNAQ